MVTAYHTDAGRSGWVGVDLDGVLVEWDPKYLPDLGPAIAHGITLVRRLRAAGKEVRIFTARVQPSPEEPAWWDECVRLGFADPNAWVEGQVLRINAFCREHFQTTLPITASKDWRMITCYDDRCVQMIPNTGESLTEIYQRKLEGIGQTIEQLIGAHATDDH